MCGSYDYVAEIQIKPSILGLDLHFKIESERAVVEFKDTFCAKDLFTLKTFLAAPSS